MTCQHLKVHRSEGVGWLEYRRIPRNAFNWGTLREVPVALGELGRHEGGDHGMTGARVPCGDEVI
jgi:hypothetical protein